MGCSENKEGRHAMPKRKQRKAPMVGTTCSRTYKAKTYTMTVVNIDGWVGFKVGRDVFDTPTGAAMAITKNAVNGWVFWGLDVENSKS
jgi:hypothetical protein